jgi:hypothetical protein
MLKKVAEESFECDTECVADCLKKQFVTFWEIPKCVMHCDCKSKLIKIEGGIMNIPKLLLYNEYDEKAWAFFKINAEAEI